MKHGRIGLFISICSVCLQFGTPANDCDLACQSMFKRALNNEQELKFELSEKDVRTFPLGPPFFHNETLWNLYCQVREQVDNCSNSCGSQWFAPGRYFCEKVEAVKNQTKCFDQHHFGQYYRSQTEAELQDPIYRMCTYFTHNQGALETFSPGTIITKANVKHKIPDLRNECLYLSCYLNGSEAKARPDCVQSIMLVRSMVHQYLWTIYKVFQKANGRHHYPEDCRRLMKEVTTTSTRATNILPTHSIIGFKVLLPTKFYSFDHVRDWGNGSKNTSIVFIFDHPEFYREYSSLQPHMIEYLENRGIPAVTNLAYNVTCSVQPCDSSSLCLYTHQCLENYCRMKVYVDQDLINRTWTCQVALVLTATNVILHNLTESPNYIRKPRSFAPPTPVPEILIKGRFVLNGSEKFTVMITETLSKTIRHFGDSLIFNDHGEPDKQIDESVLNSFKTYCKDLFSGIYYGVSHGGKSIGMFSQYHVAGKVAGNSYPIYNATNKIGNIICLPTESGILWSESNGTHWYVRKARIEQRPQTSLKTVEINQTCWNRHGLKNGLLSDHWPIYHKTGHQGISFATDQGILASDSNGDNCKRLYRANWTDVNIQAIATDFRKVYWINENHVFMAILNRTPHRLVEANQPILMEINKSNPTKLMLTHVEQISTYGPEQQPFLSKECLEILVDKPQINGNKVYVTTKWNQSENCHDTSYPPIKVDLKLCGPMTNCATYNTKQLFTFQMFHSFEFHNLAYNTKYTMIALVTIPQEFGDGLNNCDVGLCKIGQSFAEHKTGMQPIWTAMTAVIPVMSLLLTAILGLLIALKIQSQVIFHGIRRIAGSSIQVIKKIGSGSGGKSEVYQVLVTEINGKKTKMAMKALTAQSFAARFHLARDSAFVTNSELTDHENILEGIGVCFQGDTIFSDEQNYGKEVLLMELCDGNLQNYLHAKRVEQSANLLELVAIMIDIANGLDHLHGHSIIHNDLTVDNILYVNTKKTRQNGLTIICKIGDFELAKDVAKVYIGDMLTTPIHVAYSAPEVLKGKNMSRKSDMWMLGVCFWQIIMYGQIPWSFFTTPAQLFDAICNKREVLLPPENTPEELADILRICFEFDPKKRPTVEYVLKKLRSYKKYLKTNMGMASWMGQEDPNESKHCPTLQPAEDIYSSKTLCDTETVQMELNSVDGDDTNDDDDDDDVENIEDLNQSFTETSSSVEQQSVV